MGFVLSDDHDPEMVEASKKLKHFLKSPEKPQRRLNDRSVLASKYA